jgi:hypothetical protein
MSLDVSNLGTLYGDVMDKEKRAAQGDGAESQGSGGDG